MSSWLGGKLGLTASSLWSAVVSAIKGVILSGDASASHVLKGKTFYNSTLSKGTGTMTDNGAVSKIFTPSTSPQSYTIPAGHHNGSGKVTCNAASPASIVKSLTQPTWSTSANNIRGKTVTITCTVGKLYVAAMAGDPGSYNNFSLSGGTIISNLTGGDTPPDGSMFARMVLFKAASTTVTINWGADNAGAMVAQIN